MKPYYDEEGITLYHADCRDVLPLDADVLVTDPPYGIAWSRGEGLGFGGRPGVPIVGDMDTSVRDWVLALWGQDRPWIVFGSLRATLPSAWKQVLVFHKPLGSGVIGVRRPWRNNWEPVFVGGKWPLWSAYLDAVLETSERFATGYSGYVTRAGHPHAKPVDVMRGLIELTEGTVLDPFAGSGSTLQAAKDLGRKAIGIEIEERYCEIAVQRLAQGVLEFDE